MTDDTPRGFDAKTFNENLERAIKLAIAGMNLRKWAVEQAMALQPESLKEAQELCEWIYAFLVRDALDTRMLIDEPVGT